MSSIRIVFSLALLFSLAAHAAPEGSTVEGTCSLTGFDNPAGGGYFTIADAVLVVDEHDIAYCRNSLPGLKPYTIDIELAGDVIFDDEDLYGDEVTFSVGGAPATLCTGDAVRVDSVIVCPVCLADVPTDLAVQVTDHVLDLSNAACVDVLE